MNTYIDIYCERLEPGLWAEPLNAISNLAFFIAAFFAWQLLQHHPHPNPPPQGGGMRRLNEAAPSFSRSWEGVKTQWPAYLLIFLIMLIGIGSTLFHTFATHWAMLSDVLPILIFQIAFIIIYSRQAIGLNWLKTGALLILFVIVMQISMAPPRDWLNGTLEYAPALIFVTGFGIWHMKNAGKERFILLLASGIFIVSMTLRSLDMQLCPTLPLGTHYFWHIFNAAVLYLSVRGLPKN